ncbi:MAG: hypothetical protein KDA53_12580 [Hyphomonas sp.]|nr:hypothetical protein [Hyphomonas sp.]
MTDALLPCNGYSARTGKRVGSRHRWPGKWGEGRCCFCHRTVDDLRPTGFRLERKTGDLLSHKKD